MYGFSNASSHIRLGSQNSKYNDGQKLGRAKSREERQRGADYKACIRNWDGTEINEGKTTVTAIYWGYQEYKRKKYTNAILEMLFFGVKVSTHQTPNVESCNGRSFFYARDWL